jgi:hypothetical protein
VRDIQQAIFANLAPTIEKSFIGRQKQEEEFIEKITKITEPASKLIIVSGLEGIGRRSYLDKVCKNLFGLMNFSTGYPELFTEHQVASDVSPNFLACILVTFSNP